jgi:hypothetical protein
LRRREAAILHNMGEVYRLLQEYGKALEHAQANHQQEFIVKKNETVPKVTPNGEKLLHVDLFGGFLGQSQA